MAKLPAIEYDAVPQSSGRSQAAEAAGRFGDVVAQGFTAWGKELVKTQMQRADTDLSTQLNTIENDINSREYYTAGELRQVLGDDVDALPAHVKQQLQVRGADGELHDNDQIPVWAVSGPLYDRLARRAVEASASKVQMPGWQTAFKDQAAATIAQRAGRMNERQMQASLKYLEVTQTSDIITATNVARTPEEYGKVRQQLLSSNAISPAKKKLMLDDVNEAEQLRPVLDAQLSNDPGQLRAQIARLSEGRAPADARGGAGAGKTFTVEAEGKFHVIPATVNGKPVSRDEAVQAWIGGFTQAAGTFDTAQDAEQATASAARGQGVEFIKPAVREQYVKALQGQLNAIEREQKGAESEARKKVADAAWTEIFSTADRLRQTHQLLPSSLYSKLLPKPGTVDPEDWNRMNEYLEKLSEGEPFRTNPALYWAVNQSLIDHPEDYRQGYVFLPGKDGKMERRPLLTIAPFMQDDHFRHFVDLQRSGTGSPFVFKGSIGDQEAINQALVERQYDPKSKDEQDVAEMGYLSSIVNSTLAVRATNKGSALDPNERALVIREVLDREVQLKKNSWLYRHLPFTDEYERKVTALGVRPEIAVAFYEGTGAGGKRMSPDEVVAAATDYAKYEPGILATWSRYGSGKPLSPDMAVHLYWVVATRKDEIDAELKRAGQLTGDEAKDNAARAALAVRAFFAKGL